MEKKSASIRKITAGCVLLFTLSCTPSKVGIRTDAPSASNVNAGPRVGAFSASTSVTSTSFVLNWTAATSTDTSVSKAELEYYLCSSSSSGQIDTIAECKAAERVMNWRKNVSTFAVSSKSPSTTYHYNLIVRDSKGRDAIYKPISQTTLSATEEPTTLTAGAFGNSSSITTTTITLNWTAGSRSSTSASSLEYYVCSGTDADAIDTVAECEAATQRMNWTASTLSLALSGLSVGTTYFFNTIVRDTAGNKAIYGSKAESTATLPPTTNSNAERSGIIRHSFYDTLNARHWQFYVDGSTIKSQYSTNGATWVAASDLTATVTKFTVHHKVVSGTAYVFLVSEESSHDILLRRGSLSTTSISWDSAVTVFDGTSSSDLYRSPAVTTDDTNVWVAASRFDGFNWATQVRQSSNASTGNLSAWDAASTLGTPSTSLRDIALIPRGGEDIYALYQDGIAVTGYEHSGGSWTLASTGGGNAWFRIAGSAGLNGGVGALAVLGSDLYVGGDFTDAGGNASADSIAKWDGSSWSALGSGLDARVDDLAVLGSDLYVGGQFTDAGGNASADYIAKWDGSSWSALGSRLNAGVLALAVSGSDLYVGGDFTDAGGIASADYVARWNGSAWSALGSGLSYTVLALAVSGTDLYVGGYFTDAGGNPNADRIARWNGSSWSALGSGLNSEVYALAVSGSDLYVGGYFTNAGGHASADSIARWNGSAWSALGSGLNDVVTALAVSGTDLYVGGGFTDAGGNANADYVARWSGSSWSALGPGLNSWVHTLAVSGTDLYVGGDFNAGGIAGADRIARWNGSSWSALGSGLNGVVNALAVSGTDLYVGGSFTDAGGNSSADSIARWNGSSWSALGSGLNAGVNALAVSGSDLYVGGGFVNAGGNASADFVARWDGSSWSALGPGLIGGGVRALAVSGSDLYVGGDFINAGGNASADFVARWNGSSWSALGSGLDNAVYALAVSGTDLYVGGDFTDAGGNANADSIARWNGSSWSALGSGLNDQVRALAVSGTDLYVGGYFTDAGGIASADWVARWNGSSWSALGSGLNSTVSALAVSGSDLYVGGHFTDAGGIASADRIARWTGSSWVAAGTGSESSIHSSIAIGGGHVYLGYNNGVSVLKPGVATSVARFSATSNDLDEPVILYTDVFTGAAISKTYSSGSWSAATTVQASGASSPVISSVTGTSNVYGFWYRDGAFEYKRFDGSAWDVSPTTLVSTAPSLRFPTCDLTSGGGIIKCMVTTLSTAPFAINTWTLAP